MRPIRQRFDRINRRIGYRVRPSFIWSYNDVGTLGLIVGFANDGIAGVPGVLRVTVESADGKAAHERLSRRRLPVAGQDSPGPVRAPKPRVELERIET